MKINLIIIILIASFLFESCISSKSPISKNRYWGVIMTCVADTSSLFIDPIVRIKQGIPAPKQFIQSYTNPSCSNRPDYVSMVQFWPSDLILDFKDKKYFFMHSPTPTNPDIKFGEPKFSITYSFDLGKLTYNAKKRELILASTKSNWKRVFTVSKLSNDSILTLTAIRSNGD